MSQARRHRRRAWRSGAARLAIPALLIALSLAAAGPAASQDDDVWAAVDKQQTWPRFSFGGDFQNRSTSDWNWADDFEDVATSRELLYVKTQASFSERFSTTLSGLAEYNITANRDFESRYSRYDARLEELYADLHLGSVDLRLGNQIVTWGVTDVFSPTDTINSVNYSAMIDQELGHYKIPNLMAKADYYPGRRHHLEAIFIPFFRPSTINVSGGDWSVFGSRFPTPFLTESLGASAFGRDALNLLDENFPGWSDDLSDALSSESLSAFGPQPPADNLKYWEAAFRYGFSYGRVTWSGSYFNSFDDIPTFYFSPELKDLLRTLILSPDSPDASTLTSEALDLDPFHLFEARYKRSHQFGSDFSANLGPSVLRAEGTYVVDRRTYDSNLDVVELPQFTYTASLDYTFPKYVILNSEIMQVYDPVWDDSVISPRNTVYLIGYAHGSFLDDKLVSYLEILYDVTRWSMDRFRDGEVFEESYEFSGKISYLVAPSLWLGVGTICFNGPKDQLFGLLYEKSFAFLDLKYSF